MNLSQVPLHPRTFALDAQHGVEEPTGHVLGDMLVYMVHEGLLVVDR